MVRRISDQKTPTTKVSGWALQQIVGEETALLLRHIHASGFGSNFAGKRTGSAEKIALGVIDADFIEYADAIRGLYVLRDSLILQGVGNAADRLDHGPVVRIPGDVTHEAAVELQKIHPQSFEIGKRGQTAAEVVQRKSTA